MGCEPARTGQIRYLWAFGLAVRFQQEASAPNRLFAPGVDERSWLLVTSDGVEDLPAMEDYRTGPKFAKK